MAFPTVPTTAASRVLTNVQANTTATRTFPDLSGLTKNAGDLLIAICVAYQSSASAGAVFSGWTSGWTEFLDVGGTTSNMSIGAAYKWSTGSETGTISVTQAATITGHAAMIVMSIAGAHATTPPTAGAIANGTSTAADPASLDPAGWAAEDTLWIAVGGSGETSTTGSFTGISGPPTNYTGGVQTGITSDVVGGVEAAVAFRQLNATSEDVGTRSVDTSNARNSAVVIAVRPAPVVVLPIGSLTDDFATLDGAKWTTTGTVAIVGGKLDVTPLSTYANCTSVAAWDLTGGEAVIEVPQVAVGTVPEFDTGFALMLDVNNRVEFVQEQGTLYFRSKVASSNSDTTTTYSSTSHRWLKISESGGSITWWTSPDGNTWTSQRTLANPFAVTAVKVMCESGWWSGGSPTITADAQYDNFNLPPAPVDDTAALQALIDGAADGAVGSPTVIQLTLNGSYVVAGQLNIVSRSYLSLDLNGSTIQWTAADDDSKRLIQLTSSVGIEIHNGTLLGTYAFPSSGDALVTTFEHMHAIDVLGSSVEVHHLNISDFKGDGVYFGNASTTLASGSAHDNDIRRVGRNGVSVVGGDGIDILDNHIQQWGFAGIDGEPNPGTNNQDVKNVLIDGNTFGSNVGTTERACVLLMSWGGSTSVVQDVTVSNNGTDGSRELRFEINPNTGTLSRPQRIRIENNTSSVTPGPNKFSFKGVDTLDITGNPATSTSGTLVLLDNCTNVLISSSTHSEINGTTFRTFLSATGGTATATGGTAALAFQLRVAAPGLFPSGTLYPSSGLFPGTGAQATAAGGDVSVTGAAAPVNLTATGGAATAGGGLALVSEGLTAATGVATASGGAVTTARALSATTGAATATGSQTVLAVRVIAAAGTAAASGGTVTAAGAQLNLSASTGLAAASGGAVQALQGVFVDASGGTATTSGTAALRVVLTATTGSAAASGGTVAKTAPLAASAGQATAAGGTNTFRAAYNSTSGTATATGGSVALGQGVFLTLTGGTAAANGTPSTFTARYTAATGTASAAGGTAAASSGGIVASGGVATATGSVTSLTAVLAASAGTATAVGGSSTASKVFNLSAVSGTATAAGATVTWQLALSSTAGAATATGGTVNRAITAVAGTAAASGGGVTARWTYSITNGNATATGGDAVAFSLVIRPRWPFTPADEWTGTHSTRWPETPADEWQPETGTTGTGGRWALTGSTEWE